tara:strand:- start:292 stop:1683 length:1392 start_codon:yes stop_codon:yes gene_type:complete
MNEVSDFVLFLGRFHPLVVHLPIGFLMFAFLLEIFGRYKKNEALMVANPLALFAGALSALLACVLGYFLSLGGDYESGMVDSHFWFGVATTLITFLAWLIRIEKIKIGNIDRVKTNISALTLIVVLISITGHYGGNLTHGSDYLVKYMPFSKSAKKELLPVAKVEDAVVFDYLVVPILQNKCVGCHNESKKKGGLSFADSLSIVKGGKNGDVLIAGNAMESEMIKRVLLDPHHEDFMPPEGKTPLTEEETAILMYWIDLAEAGYSSKVGAIETSDDILDIASVMLGLGGYGKGGTVTLPKAEIIGEGVLQDVIAEGFKLTELVFDSNLYEVVLPPKSVTKSNAEAINAKLEKLRLMKDNILWLSFEDNLVTDNQLRIIGQFGNLQKLKLSNNAITDKGISDISELQYLSSLNLYSTGITKASLEVFSTMPNLKNVFVWNTAISEKDLEAFRLEDGFPEIVSGM